MTKKKVAEPIACAHHVLARIVSGTKQIPHRLLPSVRHHDRGQHPSAVQFRELSRITPVCLDSIAWFPRCQRGRGNRAVDAFARQQSI
jgi:hypothetical protein